MQKKAVPVIRNGFDKGPVHSAHHLKILEVIPKMTIPMINRK